MPEELPETKEVADYRFRVHVGDHKLGVMTLTGLSTANAGRIAIKRGTVRGDFFLLAWWRSQEGRDVTVTVVDVAQDAITFTLRGAVVEDIEYGTLDAGSNWIFTETAYIKYESAEIS
jgi:hypothetical protein